MCTISLIYHRFADVQHVDGNTVNDPQQRGGVSRDQDLSVASFDHDDIAAETGTTNKKLNFRVQMCHNSG